MKCVHQRATREDEEVDIVEMSCSSTRCKYTTIYRGDLKRHMEKCMYIAVDREVSHLQGEHQQHLRDLEARYAANEKQMQLEIARLQAEKDMLEQQLNKTQDLVGHLAERAIEKPTTSNTVNNNNQRITNLLCDPETYEARTQAAWITEVAREKFEPYFWQGQRGVAQFAVDHIIKTEDGKMLLCCTDPSRNRFRYLSADHRLKEDIEGRIFTKSIAIPIKSVCNEVFDSICTKLKKERASKKGAFEVDFIDKKIDHAHTQLIEIREIDDDNHNQAYKSELAVLLNV